MDKHSAIYKLYSNIVTMRNGIAYDKDEKEVIYDNNAVEALVASEAYKEKRAKEYPDFREYLDGIVKGDNVQVQKYINDCLAVKAKYPKE